MEVSEEAALAKDVLQAFLKAKKTLRMYPPNNPVYIKTVEETFRKVEEFFDVMDELALKIKQNEIFFGNEPVYQSTGKEENLALFFFKDGLRELTFKKGLDAEELTDFLKVTASDFERENIEDDVVTLFWEKDFQNIKYVVDEEFLTEDETYEEEAIQQVKESVAEEADITRAYEEAFEAEETKELEVVPITEKDLNSLVREIQDDSLNKTKRLVEILFEMLYETENLDELKDLVSILNTAVEYSVRNSDMASATEIFRKSKELIGSKTISDSYKRALGLIFQFASSREPILELGRLLDSGQEVEEGLFLEYVGCLEKGAIQFFITLLGELNSIEARKKVLSALTLLGGRDIDALAKGLGDPRWYITRNIIYVLRKIGDRRAIEFLVRAARHSDVRVRKEVLKALGELGGQGVLQTLRDFLDDPDPAVRTTAVRALGSVGTDAAKMIILDRLSNKGFIGLDFNEKKDYFTALSRWNDQTVNDYLMRTLRKRTFFKRMKNDENRACAAYCLGLLGNKDALSELHRLRDSKNQLLSEYAYAAVKRIEYGK